MMNFSFSSSPKFHPSRRCCSNACALNWVRTYMEWTPELMKLLSTKSMIRYFPPNGTAGLLRRFVKRRSRLPRPPAITIPSTFIQVLCLARVNVNSVGRHRPRWNRTEEPQGNLSTVKRWTWERRNPEQHDKQAENSRTSVFLVTSTLYRRENTAVAISSTIPLAGVRHRAPVFLAKHPPESIRNESCSLRASWSRVLQRFLTASGLLRI